MNYMDYTYDACMNMFTSGQSSRMNATLNSTRASLLTSLGCTPPSGGGTCGTASSLTSSSITSSSATLSWAGVSGATSYNVQYKPVSSGTWSSTSTAATSVNISSLSSATAYEFQVQAVCNGTSGSYSASANFTTLSSTGCTDVYESNNSSSAARTISVNTDINALISSTTDLDWYKFTTTSPNTYIQLTLTNLPYDYDVRLYSSGLSLLATSQNGGTTSETINRNTSSAGTYYVRVYGYNGAYSTSQCYKLRINTRNTPYRFEQPMSNADKDELISGIVAVPNPAQMNTSFEFLADFPGISNVYVTDITGRKVYSGTYEVEEGMNRMYLDVSNLNNGVYIIRMDQQNDRRIGKFVIER
jgi:hypothetical protein